MLSNFFGFLVVWPAFLTIFVFVIGDAEAVSEESTPFVGQWQMISNPEFKKCPANEIVVGMCRSEATPSCKIDASVTTMQKMLCRKPDANMFDISTTITSTDVAFDQIKTAQVCDGERSFLGGFCASRENPECSSKFNQMECRSSYAVDKAITKDICADYGQDIQCPEDEEDGIWAAIGFCSSSAATLCPELKCANKVIPTKIVYGLRCAKLIKKEKVFDGGVDSLLKNNTNTNNTEALSGNNQTSSSSDEDLAKLVADLMKEKKKSSANSANVSLGFVFVLTLGLMLAINS